MREYIIEIPEYVPPYDPAVRDASFKEQILRCRDCSKWSFFDVVDDVRFGDCAEFAHLEGFGHATDENGFCAWGERRQDHEG